MAGVENLQFGFNPQLLNALGARPQLGRGRHINRVAVTEVQGAAIQGADFRQQRFNVSQAGQRPDQVGMGAKLHRVFAGADVQVTAHAGREVDDDVDVGLTDALHQFAVQRHVTAELAGFRIPYMAMHHRGSGLGRFHGGVGNLLGRDRYQVAAGAGVAGTGECASDDDVVVHLAFP